jgi:predicted ArsR family transcriptional regulator
MSDLENQIGALGLLADASRRALYEFVASSAGLVSRDEAARAVDMGRSLAAYHLDLLAEEGLLEVEYKRLSGRQGPGAGRTAKLYRRSTRQIDLSLPARRYHLAGEVLASALERVPEGLRQTILAGVAREEGARLAETASRIGNEQLTLVSTLVEHGYEPLLEEAGIELRNCPFHLLAKNHRQLICGANLELVGGLIASLGVEGMEAVADPRPDRCCVRIRSHTNG